MRLPCAIICAFLTWALPLRARAANCNFSTNGIAFGSYDPTAGAAVRGAGAVEYHCSDSTWALILIDGGSSNNVGARRMTQGPERLAYNVYKDANTTNVWGDTWTNGFWTVLGKQGSVPVYGAIPAYQDAAAGAYTDTLTITIIFM